MSKLSEEVKQIEEDLAFHKEQNCHLKRMLYRAVEGIEKEYLSAAQNQAALRSEYIFDATYKVIRRDPKDFKL